MQDFKQKNKSRKFLYSLPVRIFLICIVLFLVQKSFALYKKGTEVGEMAKEVQAELAKVEARKDELQKKVDFMNTERGKEEEMRAKFMVGKPGESVIMVVDEKPTTTEKATEVKESGWTGFLKYFR